MDDDDNHFENLEQEDEELISFLKSSLEDAGFKPLSQRDLDLCDALNVGYLLRLSIVADLEQLDPGIAKEFYPELYNNDDEGDEGKLLPNMESEILFGGRCLVFWRGYSQEVTTGRLILPKLDYLQTSLVRRSAAWVKRRLDFVEQKWLHKANQQSKKIKSKIEDWKDSVIPKELRTEQNDETTESEIKSLSSSSKGGVLDLGRYGGSGLRFVGSPDPDDALDPFMVCEIQDFDDDTTPPAAATNGTAQNGMNAAAAATTTVIDADVEHDLYEKLNHQGYLCEYDKQVEGSLAPRIGGGGGGGSPHNAAAYTPRVQLLERVSISNLVNIFTKYGRRTLISTIFGKSELVEPTFEEVVVVWKPLPKETKRFYPPKFVSDLADIFDIEGFEQPPKRKNQSFTSSLKIRNFQGVPMSNIQGVFPKTKLVFRPADALLFDTISIATFALVLGSIRLDSPRLDLLALISVGLWIFRTVIRYSNKLARYDLLVKNFLTSKISHRNEGALKYLMSEAGLQRAIRSSLVLSWLEDRFNGTETQTQSDDSDLLSCCIDEINQALNIEAEVEIDVDRALNDLKDLDLVRFSIETGCISEVTNSTESAIRVEQAWSQLLLDRNAGMPQRKKKKQDKESEEGQSDIANIIAANLLTSLEENRGPIQKAIKAARKQGYSKMKEVIEDDDNRKRFESALQKAKMKGYRGYTKVKDLIKDKRSMDLVEDALLNLQQIGTDEDSDSNGGEA
ncbi:unnamed protein product [Cylindrotheca closterium]|uniref:Uncharacterized protein n=1 Tax=Cylindrotheca closterium TaxID=2856 RepID=A0AAD2FQJ2_9STRA|nr:unnamed protein product [Cylindrotheca closterium]